MNIANRTFLIWITIVIAISLIAMIIIIGIISFSLQVSYIRLRQCIMVQNAKPTSHRVSQISTIQNTFPTSRNRTGSRVLPAGILGYIEEGRS